MRHMRVTWTTLTASSERPRKFINDRSFAYYATANYADILTSPVQLFSSLSEAIVYRFTDRLTNKRNER